MKTIYLTESQKNLLLRETRLDYERINIVLDIIKKLGYQPVQVEKPDGTVKTVLVPSNNNGEYLKNKSGIITKTFDDLFYKLQKICRNSLTSDSNYRDELIKHCIAHWLFPQRYSLWLGAGVNTYVDNNGNPLFNAV